MSQGGHIQECCDRFLLEITPRNPKEGKSVEQHTCPTCGTKLNVIFECHQVLGGEWACGAVGVQ